MSRRGETRAGSFSDLALCIQSLGNEGRVAVSVFSSGVEDSDAIPVLEQLDAVAREELALPLPPFSANAALWGARLFHQLCRFVVCRDIDEKQITETCAVACPEPRSPQTDWSVDVTLHHLPKLFQLARHLSNADPLVEQMKLIAETWPLSSIGIPDLKKFHLDSFIDHPSLRRLYCDRILAVADASRLGDQRINDLLRADIGIHLDLEPSLAAKLYKTTNDTH